MSQLQTLEAELSRLVNRYSVLAILIVLKNLAKTASENNPGLDWDKDTDTLTVAIERINN